MRAIVNQWDARVRRDVSRFVPLVEDTATRGSVLRDPAAEWEVASAEQCLGLRFPPSYRAFLLLSNGARASSLGAETVNNPEHGFLPVGQVRPVVDADPFLAELWTTPPELNDPARRRAPAEGRPVEVAYFKPLLDGLLIAQHPFAPFRDVLVPDSTRNEWELWAFHKEGASAYDSFVDLLREEIGQPDRRPKAELADGYVADVRAGQLHRLDDLAEIDDPRAGDLACEVLNDKTLDEFTRRSAASTLGRLADPRHRPCLRKAYAEATIGPSRLLILAAIDASGDPDAEAMLRAAAADDPDDQVRKWADRWLAGRCPRP